MKEIEIALMLGATIENWYPPNKIEKTTGDYLIFPESMYQYIDDEGKEKGYKWYPDNKRQHCDILLKFSTDLNWQGKALDWVRQKGYSIDIYSETYRNEVNIYMASDNIPFIISNSPHNANLNVTLKEAIFEALYNLSQHLKSK